MKKLIFLCGPNGIGKTSIARSLVTTCSNTAYVDTDPCRYMNPFILNDDTIPTIAKNISDMVANYLMCQVVDQVILTYGFHGRRLEVFHKVMDNLKDLEYDFMPLLLWCDKEEQMRRMTFDGRSSDRRQRGLDISRQVYGNVPYPRLDISLFSLEESVAAVVKALKL